MKSKSILVQKEDMYTSKDTAKLKILLKNLQEAKKDPQFVKNIKAMFKHHTGKELKV